jgi:UDP-N-acetylmuramoylalanine--D-glutamate ligase
MNYAVTSAASPTGDARYAKMRVVILGLARQGIAAARFFLGQGADVIVSDLRTESELAGARGGLEAFAAELVAGAARNASLRFALGGHPAEILDGADVCLSGGVSPAIPIAQEAARRGIPHQ